MKKLIISLFFLLSTLLEAEVMFTLTNLETSHIYVSNQSSLLNESDIKAVKIKMVDALHALGLKSEGRDGATLMMKFESASVKGTDIVFIKLAVASDVITTRKDAIDTFAITYEGTDMLESEENVKVDIFESVQFLLDEFSEHYKEDN